ncbi:subtilisin-like protease SBT1.4 [Triticum aestivum]|nr:subtilisin-like protease SBT1.4 [Triticum aestivum]
MAAGSLTALCLLLAAANAAAEATSSYIVHVAPAHALPAPRRGLLSAGAYGSFLRAHVPADVSSPAPTVHYSYAHAATGFAARLTGRQAAHLASQRSVLGVVPSVAERPHTTLTPSFLGLSPAAGLLPASNGATDVVIGVLDSGVYPVGRASFSADPSLPPVPGRFRGGCVATPSFNASAYCNTKLVGAKFFYRGYEQETGRPIDERVMSKSPLDTDGHGTHTASTAAGSAATGAGFFDYARGNAVGVAPGARIAAYKVCWNNTCTSDDILAGFEAAIADGVDVISISLGSTNGAQPFHLDTTAIGAFRAVRKGIVVSASAGNNGPRETTAVNIAPWFLTVAASTVNRQFPVDVLLGNGQTFTGTSLNTGTPLGATKLPLVYGGFVGTQFCEAGKLNATMVAGKIVLCESSNNARTAKGEAVRIAGGVGLILASFDLYREQAMTDAHVLPAASVTFVDAVKIANYIATDGSPAATIASGGTAIGRSAPPYPRMASFSSRGPSRHAPEILKPDITAPGVDILAAWTGANSPSHVSTDTRRVEYNVIAGTSMSCPHVSGVAALLRQARPEWSPAAIKSAMMTTAYNVDSAGGVIGDMSTGKASTPFARGAGHVDPNGAADPGLVYDADAEDYITFLCAIGYDAKQVALFTGDGSVTDCSTRSGSGVGDLNYPAFSAVFGPGKRAVTQRRVVRNVGGNVWATYKVRITAPDGVRVTVSPGTLRFRPWRKTQEYKVTLELQENLPDKHTFGAIEWSDGQHKVKSPIAITWPPATGKIAQL